MTSPSRSRLGALLLLTLLSVPIAGHADWSPFGTYWDNLARAAQANDATAVQRIVASGISPNQTDESDRTALHITAMTGNLRIAAILIKAGAKLNMADKLGNTPLHYASERNQVELAQLLLEAGAQVDPQNNNGMTPLMIAASRGNVEVVQALLASGANVAKADYTGRDAIGWAADSHRPALLQMLRHAAVAKR